MWFAILTLELVLSYKASYTYLLHRRPFLEYVVSDMSNVFLHVFKNLCQADYLEGSNQHN